MKVLFNPILLASLALFAWVAMAQPMKADIDDHRIRRMQSGGEILPLDKILARARAVKPGRVLDADLEDDHGHLVYEIELLDARGRVWEIKLDARTGRLLELEQDD